MKNVEAERLVECFAYREKKGLKTFKIHLSGTDAMLWFFSQLNGTSDLGFSNFYTKNSLVQYVGLPGQEPTRGTDIKMNISVHPQVLEHTDFSKWVVWRLNALDFSGDDKYVKNYLIY